jgi:Flp pilus assembly protein TadG
MTRGHRRNVHLGSESGQAMVEFALILPVLLGVVIGIIQFGSAFNYWNDLNQMAGDGARFAAVDSAPGGGSLTTYIAGQGDASELRSNTTACLTVIDQASGQTKALSQAVVGDAVRVKTQIITPYSFIPIGPLKGITAAQLRGNATMRIERVSPVTGVGLSNLGATQCQ